MTYRELLEMTIRKHYKKHGAAGVQLSFPFDISRGVILKTAQRLGIKSDVKGGRKHGEPRQIKSREVRYKADPLASLLTGWYPQNLTCEGNLSWRP